MKPYLLLCLTTSLVLAGCGKHPAQTETPVPNPATTAAPASAPASAPAMPAAPAVTAIPTDASGTADLPALSRTLRGWIVGHRRLPGSFEEFVASANLSVPPPPPGKKYAINKSTVVLVNR